MAALPEAIQALLDKADKGASGPPLHLWDPPLSGDMDMRIAVDGSWYHEGDPIRRQPLVDLFASILRREGDDYVLVTPVEKWRIRVEDAPFIATDVEQVGEGGDRQLLFTLNVGPVIRAGAQHPLRVVIGEHDEPRPYLFVRDGLEARIDRNAFYALVDMAERVTDKAGVNWLEVYSDGERFRLGSF